jgi:hypothetical protein
MICPTCGADPCINPGFCALCRETDRRRQQQQTPARPPDTRRAAETTVEALMYSLRQRGVRALDETDTRRRLAELSDEQLVEVGARLRRLNPEIAAAWTADQVLILLRSRERCK